MCWKDSSQNEERLEQQNKGKMEEKTTRMLSPKGFVKNNKKKKNNTNLVFENERAERTKNNKKGKATARKSAQIESRSLKFFWGSVSAFEAIWSPKASPPPPPKHFELRFRTNPVTVRKWNGRKSQN